MPCDNIGMSPKGHGMVTAPLKCTHLSKPRTSGGCNVLYMHFTHCEKHCKSLDAEQTLLFRKKTEELDSLQIPNCAAVCIQMYSNGSHWFHIWSCSLTWEVQQWVNQALHVSTVCFWRLAIGCNAAVDIALEKKRKNAKHSETQIWKDFKKHVKDGGLNRPPANLE